MTTTQNTEAMKLLFDSRAAAKAKARKVMGEPDSRKTCGWRGHAAPFFVRRGEAYLWLLTQGRGWVCADGSIRGNDDPAIEYLFSLH